MIYYIRPVERSANVVYYSIEKRNGSSIMVERSSRTTTTGEELAQEISIADSATLLVRLIELKLVGFSSRFLDLFSSFVG